MLKILLVVLITIEILIFAVMIYCLSGINILLPGLGLVISGGLIFLILLSIEILLLLLTFFIYKRLRNNSGAMK
jgi:hypothetical protein